MPVTQSKPEYTLLVGSTNKGTKLLKHGLKLYAQGFSEVVPCSSKKPHESSHGRPVRRVPRPQEHCQYTHSDRFSSFFAGSKACLGTDNVPCLNNTFLRPNAKFVGGQQSGSMRYDIKVEIKSVDLVNSVVTGFFQISGLTDEHPIITTCFKGEIINNPLHRTLWGQLEVCPKRYSFVTEETNWSSFPKNDLEHWKKLTGCPSHYLETELREKLRRIQLGEQDSLYIYMRWKEEFLLPDSRVKLLTGASFEGFYYVVLNIGSGSGNDQPNPEQPNPERSAHSIPPGTMSGLYYYTQSEKFQSLSLRYVEDRGQAGTFDFA